MNKKYLGTLLFMFLISPLALAAFEEEWDNPKYGKSDPAGASAKNSHFKFGGKMYLGYEAVDRAETGKPDKASPDKQNQGFTLTRTYLDFQGKVNEGSYKGWGYRVTTDVYQAAKQGDGCTGATCKQYNDYLLALKYAYINIPLFEGTSLRLGQQHTPVIDGQAGVSLQKNWKYRHVAQHTFEETKLSPSADLGIGLIHKNNFMGLHLLFGNGEGYHHVSAEGVNSKPTLEELAKGSGDSYGYDLYGMISIVPTGNNKEKDAGNKFSINFPFRFHNIYGVHGSEVSYMTADFTDLKNPSYHTYQGNTRAKKDITYGVEADLDLKFGDLQLGVGAGGLIHVDRRSNAVKNDTDGIRYTDPVDVTSNIYFAEDARGFTNYLFARVKYKKVGAFARYTTGSATKYLDGKVKATDNRDWLTQATLIDAADGKFGNEKLNKLASKIDLGVGRFHSMVLGVSYFMTKTFTISVGMSELWGQDLSGREFRSNKLEKIGEETTGTGNLAEQLENNKKVKAALGYKDTEKLVLNDFIGKTQRNRQIFVRTEFKF